MIFLLSDCHDINIYCRDREFVCHAKVRLIMSDNYHNKVLKCRDSLFLPCVVEFQKLIKFKQN